MTTIQYFIVAVALAILAFGLLRLTSASYRKIDDHDRRTHPRVFDWADHLHDDRRLT